MTPATAAPAIRSTLEHAADVLSLLAGDDGALLVDARTWDGIGHDRMLVTGRRPRVLPPALLRLLESGGRWRVHASVAVRGTAPDLKPIALRCLFARFDVALEIVDGGRRCQAATAPLEAIAAALAGFPPASALIDAGTEIIGLWALEQPIDLCRNVEDACALEARLAERLGASTTRRREAFTPRAGGPTQVRDRPATALKTLVPILGPVNHDGPELDVSYICDVDLGRRYSRAAITRALEASR